MPRSAVSPLSTVAQHGLIRLEPALARRVKALDADPALAKQAREILTAQGIDPTSIEADLPLSRPRLLSFSTFRRKVNPVFYQAGEDKQCVRQLPCESHDSPHRRSRRQSESQQRTTDDQLQFGSQGRQSGRSRSQLDFAKAKKPSRPGWGRAVERYRVSRTSAGPGGNPPNIRLTEQFWSGSAKLQRRPSASAGNEKYATDSYAPGYEPGQASDGDLTTIWHTEFVGASPGYPHELVVDLGAARRVEGVLYVPRQDSTNGRVKDFEIRVSDDGKTWSTPVASGQWNNDPSFKYASLPGARARYVQLRGLSEVEGRPFMSAAELSIDISPLAADESAQGPTSTSALSETIPSPLPR